MQEKIALSPGTLLKGKEEYTVVSVLGKGGYGITYLAQSTIYIGSIPHRVDFAIKEFYMSSCCTRKPDGTVVMSEGSQQDMDLCKKEFRVEAEHLSELNKYPGIVPVNEIFEANGTIYYVMQHLGSTTLLDYIDKKGGKLDEDLAVRLIMSIGHAVKVLHQKKLTHLDIKPENVMMVDEGTQVRPVLIDFGLSRHYNFLGQVTNNNLPQGVSDGYSPIEQYVGIDSFSPTADIYSLAATLFRMLTGHTPERATKVDDNYLQKKLEGLTSANRIRAIVNAMQKMADQRTQTVELFLNELETSTISESPVLEREGKPTERLGKANISNKKWMRGGLFGICILLLMGGVSLGTYFAMRGFGQTDNVKQIPSKDSVTQKETKLDSVPPSNLVDKPAISPSHPSHPDTPSATESTLKKNVIDLGYGKWEGEIKNGKPDGYGTLTYYEDHLIDSRDENGTVAAPGDKMTGEMYGTHWEHGKLKSATGAVKATLLIGGD